MRRGTSGINALIAVNKPLGMTSHDVVARVRRAVGEKRVGHAGTLDPDASGVLVVGIGQGTRLMGQLSAERKSYLARIEFGTETTTDDAQGEVTLSAPVSPELFDEQYAQEALNAFVGESMQVPPAYSAISVNGVRAYTRARAGEDFNLEARCVNIFAAQLIGIEQEEVPSWLCSFDVSKGCYIRSIARDIGRACGSAAHISALERTSSGLLSLKDCVTLEQLEQLGTHITEQCLNPVAALGFAVRNLSQDELRDVIAGKHIALRGSHSSDSLTSVGEGDKVSLVCGTKLYGIWERKGSKLVCSCNYPAGIEGVRI